MESSPIAGLFLAIGFMILALWFMLRFLLGSRRASKLMGRLAHDLVRWCIHRVFGPPRVRVVDSRCKKQRHMRK